MVPGRCKHGSGFISTKPRVKWMLAHSFRSDCDDDNGDENDTSMPASSDRIYSYLVEQCLQSAQNNRVIFCPVHGNMGPFFVASAEGRVTSAHAAPDAVRSSVIHSHITQTSSINASTNYWSHLCS